MLDGTVSPVGVDAGLSAAELEAAQRRAHPRIAAPAVVVSGDWCSVRDISLGGICLDQKSPLEAGEIYTLVLTDLMMGDSLALEAEVVWCRSGKLGLRWVRLEEAHKKWLGKHSEDWHEESLLAAEAKNLADLVGGEPSFVAVDHSRPRPWELGPPDDEPAEPSQPLPERTESGPEPAAASLPMLQPSTSQEARSAGWARWATEQLPRAAWVVAGGLLAGLTLHRLTAPVFPLPAASSAVRPAPQVFAGTWELRKKGRIAFRETYAPDGAWRREFLWPAAPAQSGRWSEKDGVLSVASLGWDGYSRSRALVRTERWWAVDQRGKVLTLARLRPNGSVAGLATLER